MSKLELKDFADWGEYYWTYQYELAKRYYIPLLDKWGFSIRGKRILDVGCGNGGFIAAMADAGAICTGVEIKPFQWPAYSGVTYRVQDIAAPDARESLGCNFDLVVLRDVIEHIQVSQKKRFLTAIRGLTQPNGRLFVTFPPYYSPFGLHQQALLTSPLKKCPYLGWLPNFALIPLLKIVGEAATNIDNILEIKASKMPLFRFRQLIQELSLHPLQRCFYTVRPSHEIRYGWKIRKSSISGVPLLNEILTLGCAWLLQWSAADPDPEPKTSPLK